MKVEILASTVLNDGVIEDEYGYDPYNTENSQSVWLPTEADALAEFAGRICYRSFNRPNPATATNDGYMRNILAQGHYSVLEHASVTFLVRDVSRALLTELTRHRHLSFSVVSQRYVDYSATEPVIPPAAVGTHLETALRNEYRQALRVYEFMATELQALGMKRKAAREAARAVLPNAAPVDMVVTGNLRAWRDVLGKRHHVAADAELQAFAAEVLRLIRSVAPNSVQDVPEAPYGSAE